MTSKTNQVPAEWLEHDRKLRPYVWSHRILGTAGSLSSLLVALVLLFNPIARQFESWLESRFQSSLVVWLLFFGGLGLAMRVISLPLSIAHHEVERWYALSKQTLASWFGDQLKGLGLGAVLGALVLSVIRGSLNWFPEYWWVFCCCFLILFSIVLAQLAPVLLIPLFFKLKPMDSGPLKERLLDLCRKFQINVKEVYHLGLGEKTEKGNAAFLGLGRTKRIVIGDTLYEKFKPEEVEAVFAHELGHQVHNDLWSGIFVSALIMFLTFGLAQWIVGGWVLPYWSSDLKSPYGFMLFFVTLSVIQMPFGVVQAIYSRSREWNADKFADVKTDLSKWLADALERLTYQNKGQFRPNPVLEFLTYSHPAPWRRITKLRNRS